MARRRAAAVRAVLVTLVWGAAVLAEPFAGIAALLMAGVRAAALLTGDRVWILRPEAASREPICARSSRMRACRAQGAQQVCQYLYFCTSEASKLYLAIKMRVALSLFVLRTHPVYGRRLTVEYCRFSLAFNFDVLQARKQSADG
jgi:hypothetical protein